MKTLADIRRRAVAGSRLEVIGQTKRPVLVGTVRTVTNPRSLSARSYEFTSSHTGDEVYVGTWPRAGETRIIDGDTFEYELRPGPGVIRLRFLPPAPAAGCAIHPVMANPHCQTCRDRGNAHPFDGA